MNGGRALLLAAMPLLLTGAMAPVSTRVVVTVEGLRSQSGMVRACLTADPATFPDCQRDPAAHRLTVSAALVRGANGGTIAFDHVLPGRYAIALLHDENGNGRVDKMLMMPKEGFGFSRNAPVRFGPPSFKSAAFDLDSSGMNTAIRMRYLL